MATRVYLSGDKVIVDKVGDPVLSIPQYRAKFQYFGTAPIDSLDDYTDIKLLDTITLEAIEDNISQIQDQAGVFVGSNNDVLKYLEDFIFISDSYTISAGGGTLPVGAATEAKQDIQITELQSLNTTLGNFYNAFLDSLIVRQLAPPINSDKVDANVVGTIYLLKAIRITNPTLVLKRLVLSAMVTTNDNVDIILLKNPTYAVPPVWNDILDYTGAATGVQYSNPDLVGNPSTTTLTAGEIIYTVPLIGSADTLESNEITINLDNITDTYALAVIPSNSGINADVFGNINILL